MPFRGNTNRGHVVRAIRALAGILLVILFIGSTPFFANAGDEFAEKYRTYKAEMNAANASFDKKDYKSASEHYSRAIALSPFEPTSYYRRGIALFKTGRAVEAAADFDRALIIDPRLTSAYTYRGMCREKSGEYLDALKDYTAALSANPGDAAIHNNLAWLYATAEDEKIRDKKKALEHVIKAAELSHEKNPEILDTLARAHFINGQMKEAIEAENKALKIAPDNEAFIENLKMYQRQTSPAAP